MILYANEWSKISNPISDVYFGIVAKTLKLDSGIRLRGRRNLILEFASGFTDP